MKKYEMAAEIRRIVKCDLPGLEKLNVLETENMMLAVRKMQDRTASAPKPETDASLDARMEAAGMIPLTKLLADDGKALFQVHTGCQDPESFLEIAEKKHRQYLRMRMEYELGDMPKDDMFEWVFAHAAVWGDVVVNLRAALKRAEGRTSMEQAT
jgi:hypothetical protein